jgi:hypothetical protein
MTYAAYFFKLLSDWLVPSIEIVGPSIVGSATGPEADDATSNWGNLPLDPVDTN